MKNHIAAIKDALSEPRMRTYEDAAKINGDEDPSGLNLYVWNDQVSGAFLAPLHICEIIVRNAVASALEEKYGKRWAFIPAFEQSIVSSPTQFYSPRQDLLNARCNVNTVEKVIPKLKFAFWQQMFTSRHDERLWNSYLLQVMPGLDVTKSISQLREGIYEDLKKIRNLRNRIAHCEPIFKRDLDDDFLRITRLIAYRCKITADWMVENHGKQVLTMLQCRP